MSFQEYFAIDCLDFSDVTPWCSIGPLMPPTTPLIQASRVRGGTTAGQYDIWSACGSGWCLVRCTPTPMPQPQPQYRYLVGKSSTTSGQLDIWSAFGSGWPLYSRVNLVPAVPVIPPPWVDIKVVAVKKLICYCLQFAIYCL